MGRLRIKVHELVELDAKGEQPKQSHGYFETLTLARKAVKRLIGHDRWIALERDALLVDDRDQPRFDTGEVYILATPLIVPVRRVKRCKAVVGEDWNTKEEVFCDKKVHKGLTQASKRWCRKHAEEFKDA